MKSDLHIHPLGDSIEIDAPSKFELNGEYKKRIRAVVDWCCLRNLSAAAMTDHDTIQSSLYAIEYVRQAALPIKIITGAECTVCNPHVPLGKSEVHLLCLGVTELPPYRVRETSVEAFIHRARALGAFVIMSHPADYPWSFRRYWHLLDGYELKNGHRLPFEEGKQIVGHRPVPVAFCNSDFHYDGGDLPVSDLEKLSSNDYELDALLG